MIKKAVFKNSHQKWNKISEENPDEKVNTNGLEK